MATEAISAALGEPLEEPVALPTSPSARRYWRNSFSTTRLARPIRTGDCTSGREG